MRKSLKRIVLASLALAAFTGPEARSMEIQVLNATVKDAAVADAEIILQKDGEASIKGKTDSKGKVSLASPFGGVDDGSINLIVKKAGFSNLVVKCPCDGMTYAVSPTLQSLDSIRVVLNWGTEPRDLDSHLVFPGNHVNFESKNGADSSLDVDNTDGFGPETITIQKKRAGEKYLYSVHNYSDGNQKDSTRLSISSKARVFVYIGNSLVRTFVPPRGRVGNTWVVFGIGATGEFYDINKFTDVANRGAVKGFLEGILAAGDLASIPDVTIDQKTLADKLNRQGETEYHKKNLFESIMLYLEAILNNPEHGQAYSNLGLAYQKRGDNAEALWANRKAIAIASGPSKATVQASSHFNIARIYESESKWQEALQSYEAAKALKQNPAYDSGIARMKEKLQK